MNTIEKKKIDCSNLPKGWQREDLLRKTGISAGKVDVYYYSPSGKRIENKVNLPSNLTEKMDTTPTMNYPSTKIVLNSNQHIYQPPAMKKKIVVGNSGMSSNLSSGSSNLNNTPTCSGLSTSAAFRQQFDYSRGIRTDASLVPPIRQTASIFKQPVTIYKTQESKVKSDLKHGPQEKPKQLFWEKRLEGLRACDMDNSEFEAVELPKGLKPVGPHVEDDTLLQSVATALHVSVQPVTGQTATKSLLQLNAGAFVNPDQPLMIAINITDDDIRKQEERVALARKKLQDALRV